MTLTSVRMRVVAAAAALAVGFAATASAATLKIQSFARSDYAAAQAALAAFQSGSASAFGTQQTVENMRTETFERHKAWNGKTGSVDPRRTNVGSFASLGGKGYGGSAINGGTKLQVRNEDPWRWGRRDTSGLDGKWLDSNDTYGMRWTIKNAGSFNSVAFLLTDVADVGGIFSIKVGKTLFSDVIGKSGREANGSIKLVTVMLPKTRERLTVKLRHDRLNDGFGIDGATVAKVAPVPAPPAAILLVTGAAARVGFGWRKRAAAPAPAA